MLGLNAQVARAAWTVCCVVLLLCAAYLIRQTIFIFIVAILLAYMVYPLVKRIEKYLPRRVPRTLTVCIVFLVLIGIVAAGVGLIGSQLSEEAGRLREQLPGLINSQNLVQRIPLPSWLEGFRPRVLDWLRENVMSGAAETLPFIQRIGGNVLHWAGNLVYVVLVPILSFIMLKDAPGIHGQFTEWTKRRPGRTYWRAVAEDANTVLAHYIRALLLLALATFIAYSVAFALLGLPYQILLAAIAGVLEFIPLFGPLVAAVIAVFVGAVSGFDGIWWLILFIVVYRIFQDYVLNPFLMSEGAEIPPLLVIFGLLAGEQLAGVPGMFLSLPVIAFARILIRRLPERAASTS